MDLFHPFSREDMEWFAKLLQGYVPDRPEDIENIGRHREGLDLQISFVVARRSRDVFTEEVCTELARAVAKRTGALAPVVYVEGDPHPKAQELLDYVARGL